MTEQPKPLRPLSIEEKKRRFYKRFLKSTLVTALLLGTSLAFGMWGYQHFANLTWVDSFLNASMILSGMGPVSPLETDAAKLFAGFYALYSGGAFLIAMAVMLAPLLHHFFKSFEVDK